MLKLVVCIKQVPMAAELPWDAKTGTLRREAAEGMMNPACKHALEAALQLKEMHGGEITVMTMGPPAAEEVLHEARAMGADQAILLTDPTMAGADTMVTSRILARAIEKFCPQYDLVLCGDQTSDSETGHVGPQLAEDLDIPGVSYVHEMELTGKVLRLNRLVDDFLETLEMDLPGLVTITLQNFKPRYASMDGLQETFEKAAILRVSAAELGLDPDQVGGKASPTRILDVYSPSSAKKNVVLKGPVGKIMETLFQQYEQVIGTALGKDLTMEFKDNE